jgi:hypothetical protein
VNPKGLLGKFLAVPGLLLGALLIGFGGYNAVITLLAQVFSDFYDFQQFSLVNLFRPYTSLGGSGTFLDSLVAGPGASGGSAIRYWTYMAYALITAVGYGLAKTCLDILKPKP